VKAPICVVNDTVHPEGDLIGSFMREEEGNTAIEYSLVAALVGVAVLAAVLTVGKSTQGLYESVGAALSSASP
jgi:pilus assembly protein Flp/PilA